MVRHSVGHRRHPGLGVLDSLECHLACCASVYLLKMWGLLQFCEMAGMMRLCSSQNKGTVGVGWGWWSQPRPPHAFLGSALEFPMGAWSG